MKKTGILTVIGVIVVVAAVVGIYEATKHKSNNSNTTSNYTYSTTNNTTNTSTSNSSSQIIQTKTASGVGQYIANSSGYTLYTYGSDTPGVSNCSGSCLSAWPAYAPVSSSNNLATNVTIITRSDGSKQYAYKGYPLYTFTGDTSPGQVTGNGVSGFSVAKP